MAAVKLMVQLMELVNAAKGENVKQAPPDAPPAHPLAFNSWLPSTTEENEGPLTTDAAVKSPMSFSAKAFRYCTPVQLPVAALAWSMVNCIGALSAAEVLKGTPWKVRLLPAMDDTDVAKPM